LLDGRGVFDADPGHDDEALCSSVITGIWESKAVTERRCLAERSEARLGTRGDERSGGEQIRRICEPRRARNAVHKRRCPVERSETGLGANERSE